MKNQASPNYKYYKDTTHRFDDKFDYYRRNVDRDTYSIWVEDAGEWVGAAVWHEFYLEQVTEVPKEEIFLVLI